MTGQNFKVGLFVFMIAAVAFLATAQAQTAASLPRAYGGSPSSAAGDKPATPAKQPLFLTRMLQEAPTGQAPRYSPVTSPNAFNQRRQQASVAAGEIDLAEINRESQQALMQSTQAEAAAKLAKIRAARAQGAQPQAYSPAPGTPTVFVRRQTAPATVTAQPKIVVKDRNTIAKPPLLYANPE